MNLQWAGVVLDVCLVALVIGGSYLGVIDKTTCAGVVAALVGARVMQIRSGGGPRSGGHMGGSLTILLMVLPLSALVHSLLGSNKVA